MKLHLSFILIALLSINIFSLKLDAAELLSSVELLSSAGFPMGRTLRTIVGREFTKGKEDRMIVLSPRDKFEVLPLYESLQQLVLVDGRRKVWILSSEINELLLNEPDYLYGASESLFTENALVFRPFKNLPAGVGYCWILKDRAKLHVLRFDLEKNHNLEFIPVITSFYDEMTNGDRKKATIKTLSDDAGAIAAINGTFFSTGRNYGEPLGNVIVAGDIAYEVTNPDILGRCRSFFASTSKGRMVIGETSLTSSLIISTNNSDEFCPHVFEKGERVVSLLGGFGWLVKKGNSKGWSGGVERQFGAEYYSKAVRRPQTVIGLSKNGREVIFLAQEGYPHGLHRFSLPELAVIIREMGAWDAVFADGGGSTEMTVQSRSVVRTEGLIHPRQVSTALIVLEK